VSESNKQFYRIFKKVKDYIAYGLLTIGIMVVVTASVNASGYRLGSEILIDGETIGLVVNRDYVHAAIEQVSEELYEHNLSFEREPVFIGRVVSPSAAMTQEDVRNAIMSTIDNFVEGYALVVDGEPILALVSEEAAELALENHKNRYVAGNISNDSIIEFDAEVEISNQFVPVSSLRTVEGALLALEPALGVRHTFVKQYVEEIPYEVERVNDYQLYRGRTAVGQAGQRGEDAIIARVVQVNGVEVHSDILERTTLRQPTTRIERIGQAEPPPTIAHGRFIRPAAGTLTSRFGRRWGRMHNGIDIAGPVGTYIRAADGGIVTFSGWDGGFGNIVRINHENGYSTWYAHNSANLVRVGERVAQGQVIARMGSTGSSTGSHLHFEVRRNGVPVDPWPLINR